MGAFLGLMIDGESGMESQMPRFKVAHLNEQGQDMVIIPLDSSFGSKSDHEQREIIGDLQAHSWAAGLEGTVVPVWESGGRMTFIAPRPWHPFFQSISLQQIWASINTEIFW
ncbi:MAG: hypothetical protein ACHQRJ_03015 [Alphaproteobacteria bacterium]